MKQEKWTKDLQDRLADYEMPAPEGLWEEIESALPKPKARTRHLRRWAAAAAIGALLIGGGTFLWMHDGEESRQMAEMRESGRLDNPDNPTSVILSDEQLLQYLDQRAHLDRLRSCSKDNQNFFHLFPLRRF